MRLPAVLVTHCCGSGCIYLRYWLHIAAVGGVFICGAGYTLLRYEVRFTSKTSPFESRIHCHSLQMHSGCLIDALLFSDTIKISDVRFDRGCPAD